MERRSRPVECAFSSEAHTGLPFTACASFWIECSLHIEFSNIRSRYQLYSVSCLFLRWLDFFKLINTDITTVSVILLCSGHSFSPHLLSCFEFYKIPTRNKHGTVFTLVKVSRRRRYVDSYLARINLLIGNWTFWFLLFEFILRVESGASVYSRVSNMECFVNGVKVFLHPRCDCRRCSCWYF